MTISYRSLIAAGLLAGFGALAQPALARDLVTNDEHASVQDRLAESTNIVGGGALVQQRQNDNSTRVIYLQDNFAQTEGNSVPMVVGTNNEDLRTIYVPAAPRG